MDESFGDGGYIKIPVNDKRISYLCITKETRKTKSKHIWVLVGCNGLRMLKLSKSGKIIKINKRSTFLYDISFPAYSIEGNSYLSARGTAIVAGGTYRPNAKIVSLGGGYHCLKNIGCFLIVGY